MSVRNAGLNCPSEWCPQCKFIVIFPPSRKTFPTPPSRPTRQRACCCPSAVPAGRSRQATWACSALWAFSPPFAVLCGILAIRELRTDPNLHGMGRAIFGIVMGSLFSVLYGLALLMAIFAPHY